MKQNMLAVPLIILFSSSVLANCPDVSAVQYGCIVIGNQKYCSWSAAWFEGFPEQAAHEGDQAVSFQRVFWSTAEGEPPAPGHIGSAVCFYESPYGNIIELVQNIWGGVSYPAGKNWRNGSWQGYLGRECVVSAADCHFNYPVA